MSLADGEASKRAEDKTHGHVPTKTKKSGGGKKKPAAKKPAKPAAKRTTLEAAKKALNPSGKKAAPATPLFTKPKNAAEKAQQNEDAKASVEALVKKYQAIESAESNASRVGKAAGQAIKASMAALKEAIEEGVDINANESAYKDKCDRVGSAWQEFEEAKTRGAQERRDAAKLVKSAREAMKKEVDESRQLALAFG